MNRGFWLIVFAFSVIQLYAQESYTLATSTIRYSGYHVAHDWTGASTKAAGILILNDSKLQRIAVSVPLASFDSNSSNRDSNALRVLNALLHPEARFYSEQIRQIDDESVELLGFFELNGIRQDYKLILRLTTQENECHISGKFKLNLNDFDLKLPRFLLKPIDEEIDVDIELKFKQNP